jgi:two-component system, chemotaxis family, CheB/CheR fusion protein
MNIRDLIPEGQREKALAAIRRLSRTEILEPRHVQRIAKDGRVLEVWMTSTALVDETGHMYAIATTERLKGPKNGSNGETDNEEKG